MTPFNVAISGSIDQHASRPAVDLEAELVAGLTELVAKYPGEITSAVFTGQGLGTVSLMPPDNSVAAPSAGTDPNPPPPVLDPNSPEGIAQAADDAARAAASTAAAAATASGAPAPVDPANPTPDELHAQADAIAAQAKTDEEKAIAADLHARADEIAALADPPAGDPNAGAAV